LTPLTVFTASANDRVQTPQQQLMGGLQNPSGPPEPVGGTTIPGPGVISDDGLSIDNSIYRYRQYHADLTHFTDRMQYDLGVFATLRDRLAGISTTILNPHEKTYGIRMTVGRNLRRDLHGSVRFQVSKANEFNGTDRLIQGSFNLNYNFSKTMSFRFDASVLNRNSDRLLGFQNGSVTDIRALVGVTKSF
jgi:predicted porin